MGTSLNKKVLCFIDEFGTAGATDLYFGAVFVLARDAGRLDKAMSDLLPATINEVHASRLEDALLQGLLSRLKPSADACAVFLNQACTTRGGDAPVIYAHGLIDTVKTGLKLFKKEVLNRENVGNVDIITDVNHHNDHPAFDEEIARAQAEDGRFRGVNRLSKVDSATSRLLQLADVVAYGRKWMRDGELNARVLQERFSIRT